MRLPTYQPQADVRIGTPAATRADVGSFGQAGAALARAGEQTSTALFAVADKAKREQTIREEQDAHIAAAKIESETRLDWTDRLGRAQEAAAPGADQFTPSMVEAFDKDAETRLKAHDGEDKKNARIRELLEVKFAALRTTVGSSALAFEAASRAQKRLDDVSAALETKVNTLRSDPDQYDAVAGGLAELIDNAGLSAAQRAKFEPAAKAKLAQAMLRRLNEDDPARARALLDSDLFNDTLTPENKNQLLHETGAAERRIESERRQAEREALMLRRHAAVEARTDALAQIADRGYAKGLDSAALREFYPAIDEEIGKAEAHYAARREIALAPPEEEQKLLARFAAPKEGTYARDVGYRAALRNAYEEKHRHLAADPADYVRRASPALAEKWQNAKSSSEFQSAVNLTLDLQARLGVEDWNRRALPKDIAGEEVKRLAALAPEAAGKDMVDKAILYGDVWPAVYADLVRAKLPPAIEVLGWMDRDEDAQPRAALARAMKSDVEDLRKGLPPSVKASEIDRLIATELAPFAKAIGRGGTANDRVVNSALDAAKRLAYLHARVDGLDETKAAQRAANEIVLSRWDIVQTSGVEATVPKTADRPRLTAEVENYAAALRDGLKAADVVVPAPRDRADLKAIDLALGDDRRADAYAQSVRGGTWINNRTSDGWLLVDATGRPALRRDGTTIGFKFKDVPPAAPSAGPSLGSIAAP